MPTFTTTDGTSLYYSDWGTGQPIVFSHGWPLNSNAWENQMFYLASHGYRCIAHDRRGHGQSSQPWNGNDMDTYGDDLAALIEHLNLKDAILVGHSTGGGESTRCIGRHGTKRIAGLVLIGAVVPGMLKSASNPNGVPMSVFDDIRNNTTNDRSQFFKDLSAPFYGANRPGSTVSQGVRDTFWLQGMQGSLKAEVDCVAAFSESVYEEDLKKVNVPLLVIHGSDDQIVPIDVCGRRTHAMVSGSELKVYEGAPHGLATTHAQKLNEDLLAFAQSCSASAGLKKAS